MGPFKPGSLRRASPVSKRDGFSRTGDAHRGDTPSMQILTCVRPWELVRSVVERVVPSKALPSESSRHALRRRATQSALPPLPPSEAHDYLCRAAKNKRHSGLGGPPLRHMVDEYGHDVLLHNAPFAQGQYGRAYVGLACDPGGAPKVRIFKKLRLSPCVARHDVEPTHPKDLLSEVVTGKRAQSALAPRRVLMTLSRRGHSKAYLELPVMCGTLRDLLSVAHGAELQLLTRAMLRDGLAQLAQVHARGVIHRDVKPENLFFDGTSLALGDWGLACLSDDRSALKHGVGTPSYAAPEVLDPCMGRRSPAMDLWSLGASVLQAVLQNKDPWTCAYERAYRNARDHGASRTRAHGVGLAQLCEINEHYTLWYAQQGASCANMPDLRPFAEAFAHIDPPLRTLLLRLLAPQPEDRGSAAEHAWAVQCTPDLMLDATEGVQLRAFYAKKGKMNEAVCKRLRALEHAAT